MGIDTWRTVKLIPLRQRGNDAIVRRREDRITSFRLIMIEI